MDRDRRRDGARLRYLTTRGVDLSFPTRRPHLGEQGERAAAPWFSNAADAHDDVMSDFNEIPELPTSLPVEAATKPPAPTRRTTRSRRSVVVGGAVVGVLVLSASTFMTGRQSTAAARADLADDVDALQASNAELRLAQADANANVVKATRAVVEITAELARQMEAHTALGEAVAAASEELVDTDVCGDALDRTDTLFSDFENFLTLLADYGGTQSGSAEEAAAADRLDGAYDALNASYTDLLVETSECQHALENVRSAVDDAMTLANCADDVAPLRAAVGVVDAC
jgi:hypothetical protein